jgi:hypothetical protein
MKKSSNIRNMPVNEENCKKAPCFGIDVQNINLEEVLKLELNEVMFRAGLATVQRLIAAEVEKLAGPRYSRGSEIHRWGQQQGMLHIDGQKVNIEKPLTMALPTPANQRLQSRSTQVSILISLAMFESLSFAI